VIGADAKDVACFGAGHLCFKRRTVAAKLAVANCDLVACCCDPVLVEIAVLGVGHCLQER
jgi:hypothetical protein